jgi:hypothetical protein
MPMHDRPAHYHPQQQQNLVAAPAPRGEMTVAEIRKRKELIDELLRELMVPGQHYGEIPGTDGKPALLKSGAEMLCTTFRLAPTFNVVLRELPNNHREYRVDCTLTATDGSVVATGLGSASTMESKHRWRLRNLRCPECGTEAIRKGREAYFCGSKLGGCGENFDADDRRIVTQPKGKIENPDVADQWNTVLKIAAKRAHVHAVLLATGASDMFVHEEDDDGDDAERAAPAKKPAQRAQQPAKQQQQRPEVERAPMELTPKMALLRDCVGMHEQLTRAGRTKQQLIDLLGRHGVEMPAKWGELDEQQLATVRQAFADELALGTEVQR